MPRFISADECATRTAQRAGMTTPSQRHQPTIVERRPSCRRCRGQRYHVQRRQQAREYQYEMKVIRIEPETICIDDARISCRFCL